MVCGLRHDLASGDHATGRIRGLLCFNCNQALGNPRDSVETLLKLADYLGFHREDDDADESVIERELRSAPRPRSFTVPVVVHRVPINVVVEYAPHASR